MKNTIITIALILTFIFSDNVNAQNNLDTYRVLPGINVTQIDGIDYVHRDQKLHVKLVNMGDLLEFERFLEANGASISRPFNRLNWGVVKLEDNVDLISTMQVLKDNRFVEFAEPLVVAFPGSQPNDPDLHKQWYVRNTGQLPTGGTPGASAHFADAWMLTTGSSGVAVGILDSGIAMINGQLSHPDLQNSSRIIPRMNLVDANDPDFVRDIRGHGTFVAGIIGAEANNQVGISGVSPESKLLIYKTSNQTDADHLQDALLDLNDWATNTGDRVILNYSFGTQTSTQGLFDAVEYSYDEDILLVSITWNDGLLDGIRYPAKYADQFSNVIAVGGTDKNDFRTVSSNYGPEVTIAAPGGTSAGCKAATGVYSTLPGYGVLMTTPIPGDPFHCVHDNNYSFSVGTSWAAPQVAGAAALLLSMDSTLTPTEIRDRLTTSADKVGGYNYNWNSNKPGHSQELGHGRLNAYSAVKHALPLQIANSAIPTGTLQASAHVTGNSTIASGATVTVPTSKVMVIDGNVSTTGSRSTIRVEGKLIVDDNSTLTNTLLDIRPGGQAIIPDGASVNTGGGNVTVHSGAALQMHNNTTLNTAGGGVLVLSGAELQVHDNVSFLMDEGLLTISSTTQIGSQFNFVNGFISTSTSASLTIGSGASLAMAQMAVSMPEPRRTPSFVVRGNLHLLGGTQPISISARGHTERAGLG